MGRWQENRGDGNIYLVKDDFPASHRPRAILFLHQDRFLFCEIGSRDAAQGTDW
jgi:hypothetical protein